MAIINWDSVCLVYVLFVHECGTGKMGQIADGGYGGVLRGGCCGVGAGWWVLGGGWWRPVQNRCWCVCVLWVYLPLLSVVYRLYLDILLRYNRVTGWLLYLVCPVVALVSCRS